LIRVVIADDVPIFREMVVEAVEGEEDIEVVGEAANGRDAVALCQSEKPDIVILDVQMPLMDGVEATRAVVACCPDTRVVILTAYEDDHLIFQLVQAGATGYLLKDTPIDEVIRAIRVAHSGESLIQPRVAQKILRMFAAGVPGQAATNQARPSSTAQADSRQDLLSRLTSREREVLAEIGRGRNNKELAEMFQIGGTTVKTHVARVMQKLEVRDRIELVLLAVQAGLVEGPL
jgi:DNA-binding NarL/FixJ family response regulator